MLLNHTHLRSAAVLLMAAGLLLPATTTAATVAFASFIRQAHARSAAEAVRSAFGIEARIVPATVNGTDYLRVLGPTGMSEPDARRLLNQARAAGFESSWYLPETAPVPSAPDPVATTSPASAAAAAPEPAPEQSPEPGAAAQTPSTRDPVPMPDLPGTVPDTLLLTTTGFVPGEAIIVPRFEESDIHFKLDGRLDEPVWSQVPGYDDMRVLEPDTLAVPRHRTVMRYFYTSRGLYISMYAEQPEDTLMERLSSRDDFFSRDSMSVTLDTSGAGIYGYWFNVALGDSLSDGKIAPERQYSREWDGPWDGRSAKTAYGWSGEMFLPWSMMAMPATSGPRRIGLYASRQVGYIDERFGYPHLPSTGARFMSALQAMDLGDVSPRRQLDFYPYISGTQDIAADEFEAKVGLDLFWRPSTNLQMSAAVNPDFGAVESDDVVINLTATEVYFPEKRLFFLEGNEVFETTPRSRPRSGGRSPGSRRTSQLFNPEPTQIVNTRRIGGAPDVIAPGDVDIPGYELSKPTDLIGAVKATGQIGRMRYGAMAAVEDDIEVRGYDENDEEVMLDAVGRDFGVARLLYEQVGRSRRSIGYIGTFTRTQTYDAIVHGVDAHFLNRTGKLQADLQLLASDIDSERGYGGLLDIKYTQRQGMVHTLSLDAQDDKLDINDLGFLRRNDNYGGNYGFSLTKSKGLERLRSYNLNFSGSYWQNGAGEATRTGFFFRPVFTFPNLLELRPEIDYFPERWDDLESEGHGSYRLDDRWVLDLAFGTNASKPLSFSGRLGARQEELSGWTVTSALGLTWKPNFRYSFDLDLNYMDRDGWLVNYSGREFTTFAAQDFQPRLGMDLFITARQQFRMSLQWAGIKAKEQQRYFLPEDGDGYLMPVDPEPDDASRDFVINRMTVQLRYRWQIAPLSDLILVYTRGSNVLDNSVDDDFGRLFQDALTEPVIDFFVVKLRYRFGM